MKKTKRKAVVRTKVVSKAVSKEVLPVKEHARLSVLLKGFKAKQVKLGVEVNLAKLKLGKELYADLISSKPFIGSTTRKGLALAGIKCECIKSKPTNANLWSVVKFTRK